jgi:hypothetical protein
LPGLSFGTKEPLSIAYRGRGQNLPEKASLRCSPDFTPPAYTHKGFDEEEMFS